MVYILTEQQFANYPWCQRAVRGIYEEGRKKRIPLREVSAPDEIPSGWACVLLVGASEQWMDLMIRQTRDRGLHPIVLSNRQIGAAGDSVSAVMMDIQSSMQLAVDYLHSLGRTRLALFGVNPGATSDPWRVRRFSELTNRSEHVFSIETTMEEAVCRFYGMIGQYDGVICASDYAAVSLLSRLRERGYPVPEQIYLLSYGNMFLSRLSRPSITSISDNYESFGRAALSICAMLEKNDTVSVIHMLLKSRLHIRETTENRPCCPEASETVVQPLPENRFFRDPEITELAKLETLLNHCDETDFALLELLPQNISYADLAEQCFISETAAKYRVRKMQKLCGVETREELTRRIRLIY